MTLFLCYIDIAFLQLTDIATTKKISKNIYSLNMDVRKRGIYQ